MFIILLYLFQTFDDNIPSFNEWDGEDDRLLAVNGIINDDAENSEDLPGEDPPSLAESSQVKQARSKTTVYEEIRRFTCDSIRVVYLRVVYEEIRRYTEKNYGRLRSPYTMSIYDLGFTPYFSVCDRIPPYTITEIYDRNTVTCNPVKYGRLRQYFSRTRSYTIVYGVRNVRPGFGTRSSSSSFINNTATGTASIYYSIAIKID
jgi:hypothetical protein